MDKYIIFLPDIIVNLKKCFYKYSKYSKLLKSLRKNGIKIIAESEINKWIEENNTKNSVNLLFDYESLPELNKLYIYLCGSLYFSDDNYSKFKFNLEKELLLLLCGYLGCKEVSIITNNKNVNENKIETNLELNNISENININNNKNYDFKDNIKEIYTLETKNLLFEKDKNEFEKKLFENLENINRNFVEYYKICLKLQIFTLKRFNLRMHRYSYKIDEEFKNEKMIQTKTLLCNYGLGLEFKNTNLLMNSYTYDIIFYENDELFFYNDKNTKCDEDIFCKLRKNYEINKKIMIRDFDENWGGEPNAIFEEIIKFAEKNNLKEQLEKWFSLDSKNYSILMGDCHWINSEIYVKKWFNEHIQDCKFNL